ncbi:MAG TPA: hypothetical protein VG898_12485 [Solirubrobacterales bacterium]|nr:hypothetical protein [Solirubrobacterales bacterium]
MSRKPTELPSSEEEPVQLAREDRRRLYELLGANVPARLQRIEYGCIALTVAVASPKIGGPSVHEAVGALVHLLF